MADPVAAIGGFLSDSRARAGLTEIGCGKAETRSGDERHSEQGGKGKERSTQAFHYYYLR